jgi:1-acyl-sn-glycerol-3-phosphate acyltransferase
MVALKARVPIVPVGIIGSYDILPKGAKFPRFKRARLVIGKPIYLNKFYGKKADYKTLEKITEMVMKEIAKLICQKYEFKGE